MYDSQRQDIDEEEKQGLLAKPSKNAMSDSLTR